MPAVKAEAGVKTTEPLLTVPEPSEVAPSRKVTVPLMVPAVCEATVAVKVGSSVVVMVDLESANVVVVAAKLPPLTTWETVFDVDGAKLESPPYIAMTE